MEELKTYKVVTYPMITPNRYKIGPDGIVIDMASGSVINPHIDRDGYLRVDLRHIDNKYHHRAVHRLVGWEYCKNRDVMLVIDHIDGNKRNNYYKNLEWVTSAENTKRAIENGLRNTNGERNPNNCHSEETIRSICQMFASGMTNMDVFRALLNVNRIDFNSKRHNSIYSLIVRLRHREAWKSVTDEYEYPSDIKSAKIFRVKDDSLFSEDDVHKICQMYCSGMKLSAICLEFGVRNTDTEYGKYMETLYRITAGKQWAYITSQYNLDGIKRIKHVNRSYLNDQIFDMCNK